MRMHLSLPSMLLAASAALSPAAVAQSGGAYSITSSVIAGGGATFSTGGAYSLGGTIGQPDASSAMTGGSYSLTGGFWPRVAILLKADTNGDGSINVGDVFYLINSLFAGGAPPVSACSGDANSDASVNVGDVFFIINYLFAGGAAPTPPGC